MEAVEYRPNVGDKVRLYPDQAEPLIEAKAEVVAVYEWGAVVACPKAAAGSFRAAWHEMKPYAHVNGPDRARAQAKDEGYTGNQCDTCGSMKVVRSGTCETCTECGNSLGGCS